jgi:hypothetical protein
VSGLGVAWIALRGALRRSLLSAMAFLLRVACDRERSKLGCALPAR